MAKNIQKIDKKSVALTPLEKVIVGGFSLVKMVYKVPMTAGKYAGKGLAKVGKICLEQKIQECYEKSRDNKFYTLLSFCGWMILLLFLMYKIYPIFSFDVHQIINTPSIIGYLFLGMGTVFFFIRDMLRIISWEKQENTKEMVQHYAYQQNANELKKILLSQDKSLEQSRELKQEFESCTETYEILKVYDKIVLAEMDAKAEYIINKYAGFASVGNLLSPKLSWNYMTTLYAFTKMLREIAHAYQVKLSISTFFMLLSFGLSIVAIAPWVINYIRNNTNKHHETLKDRFGNWLITSFLHTAAICCVMSFLGYAIKYVVRPIEPND